MNAVPAPHELARYERLISLSVRHEFYGAAHACPDFAITPTASTNTLLRNLGLIAKPRSDGIDIYYHTGRTAQILQYLWKRRRDHRDAHSSEFDLPRIGTASWTRLTLAFTLDNPLFTNFTDMPFSIGPNTHCLYLSNLAVDPSDRPVPLTVDWSQAIAAQEITFSAAHVRIPTPNDATYATIYDRSGRAILIADKNYDPDAKTQSPNPQVPRRVRLIPGKDINLDMATELAGLYSYTIRTDKSGIETQFFYSGTQATPLLMADLFFDGADSPHGENNRFPVTLPDNLPDAVVRPTSPWAANLAAQQYFKPIDYEIGFRARKTIWTYYVVLPKTTAADGLSIEAGSPNAPTFTGPHPVTLVTGRPAHKFVAKTTCALQSRSDVSLRLRGARTEGSESTRVLLERLPLPSAELMPLQQLAEGPARSDVFVYL
jgi:hypothetical protein